MMGWTEILIIFGIVLLIFGAARIPSLARALGNSINEFKKGLSENDNSEDNGETE